MPPDVFLVLASSGISLVASLLFLVSEDAPRARQGPTVTFCTPPSRPHGPPPLPALPECTVGVSTQALHGVMTLKLQGDEWLVTLETTPLSDTPATRVRQGREAGGAVNDLRWHGEAGLARAGRRSWRQKPGRA